MADISKITLPDSSEYNIKDATARSIANGKSTVSVSQTLTSGAEIGSVTVDGTATKLYAPHGVTQNTWYGTCPTGATAQTKVVTTSSGDFSLTTGSMVRVKFTNAQTYNGGIKLNVDETGAKNVMRQGTTVTTRYFYLAGEVVDFVFDGTNYIAVNEGIATTTYYGVTKLSNATNSTSASLAATPAAVKAAYDHASSKQDALVSGTNIKTINGESILGSGDLTVGVHFGESSSVTFPFAAQKDGIITIGVSPSSNVNAYFIIGDGSGAVYRSNMFYGFGTAGQFFVKKGKTYAVISQDGVKSVNATFSPLEIGQGTV